MAVASSPKRVRVVALAVLVAAAIVLQVAHPVPPLVLGVAAGSGLIGGFIPQVEGWTALRVFVHIVPISFAVATRLSAAPLGAQFLFLAQGFLVVVCASVAVVVLFWDRRR
jgi:hypothetical protein